MRLSHFFAICLMVSCGIVAAPTDTKDRITVDFTLMSEASLEQAQALFQKEKFAYWRPSVAEVAKIADLIHAALAKGRKDPVFIGYPVDDWRFEYLSRKIEEVLSRYPSYACQVIGLADKDRKFIAFSFFTPDPERPKKDLDSMFVRVFDGGAGYWRIIYDLTEKRFVHFEENGDA